MPLRWYVDYCCRDDYGAGIAHVSAWAGVHYFASRRGRAANADADAVVTWPEGNGWLVQQLAAPLWRANAQSAASSSNIEHEERACSLIIFDLARDRSVRVRRAAVVCATPRFVAQRIVRGSPAGGGARVFALDGREHHARSNLPAARGAPLAWDNVARDSASLGYVVATHQSLHPVPRETVLTHYWPLDAAAPREERQRALARTHADWCQLVVADLERTHPGIDAHIRNIDVWLWGHGMIRPSPGFIWGEARDSACNSRTAAIVFAHSDMSGISIFEEAFTRGTQAADALLGIDLMTTHAPLARHTLARIARLRRGAAQRSAALKDLLLKRCGADTARSSRMSSTPSVRMA